MARKKPTDPLQWLDRAKQLTLAQWKKPSDADGTAVYLVDPTVRKEIRRYLIKKIWPAAHATLTARGFELLGGDEPIIENEWRTNACCSARLIVEDPHQPRIPGEPGPPWFCRMTVDCHAEGVRMLHDELFLHLPMRTDLELLADLLRETTHEGLPTCLHFEQPALGEPIWVVAFERGAGARQGRFKHLPAPEIIGKRLSMYCDFIEIANDLVGAPNNALTYQRLAKQINVLFENEED